MKQNSCLARMDGTLLSVGEDSMKLGNVSAVPLPEESSEAGDV